MVRRALPIENSPLFWSEDQHDALTSLPGNDNNPRLVPWTIKSLAYNTYAVTHLYHIYYIFIGMVHSLKSDSVFEKQHHQTQCYGRPVAESGGWGDICLNMENWTDI